MEKGMVSVVIASFNRAQALRVSVGSVLNQTHRNLEVIVIDDGSVDDTEMVIQSIGDARVRYFKNEINRGATYSRNRGLEHVRGEYFVVWDSDDILYSYALERVVSQFRKNPTRVTVSASTRVYSPRREEVIYNPMSSGDMILEKVICGNYVKHKLVRVSKTELCKDVRYQGRNLDFMFNTQLVQKGVWYHLSEYLGDHFLQSDILSLTKQRRKPDVGNSTERSLPLTTYLDAFKSIMIRCCPEKYAAYAYGAALGLLLSGNKRKAITMSRESVIYSSRNLKYVMVFCLLHLPFSQRILELLFKLKAAFIGYFR